MRGSDHGPRPARRAVRCAVRDLGTHGDAGARPRAGAVHRPHGRGAAPGIAHAGGGCLLRAGARQHGAGRGSGGNRRRALPRRHDRHRAHRRARSDVPHTRGGSSSSDRRRRPHDGPETSDGASAAGHDAGSPAGRAARSRADAAALLRSDARAGGRAGVCGLRAAEQRWVAGVRRRRDRGGGGPVGADAHPPPPHERVPARVRLGDDGPAGVPGRRAGVRRPRRSRRTARRGTDQRRALSRSRLPARDRRPRPRPTGSQRRHRPGHLCRPGAAGHRHRRLGSRDRLRRDRHAGRRPRVRRAVPVARPTRRRLRRGTRFRSAVRHALGDRSDGIESRRRRERRALGARRRPRQSRRRRRCRRPGRGTRRLPLR